MGFIVKYEKKPSPFKEGKIYNLSIKNLCKKTIELTKRCTIDIIKAGFTQLHKWLTSVEDYILMEIDAFGTWAEMKLSKRLE